MTQRKGTQETVTWRQTKRKTVHVRGSIPCVFLSCQFPNSIGLPSSLRHLIVGRGCPLAEHRSVTLRFSLTVTSVLVSEDISGGTSDKKKKKRVSRKEEFKWDNDYLSPWITGGHWWVVSHDLTQVSHRHAVDSPTTSRNPTWNFMGTVFIWPEVTHWQQERQERAVINELFNWIWSVVLTHVAASIRLLDVTDMQVPMLVIRMT